MISLANIKKEVDPNGFKFWYSSLQHTSQHLLICIEVLGMSALGVCRRKEETHSHGAFMYHSHILVENQWLESMKVLQTYYVCYGVHCS